MDLVPEGTRTVEGRLTAVELLASKTVAPDAGAGLARVTVQVVSLPLVRLGAAHVSDEIPGTAASARTAEVDPFKVPVMVTVSPAGGDPAVTVKLVLLAPGATVTGEVTVRSAELELRGICAPALVAAALSVRLQVTLVPALIEAGQVMPVKEGEGSPPVAVFAPWVAVSAPWVAEIAPGVAERVSAVPAADAPETLLIPTSTTLDVAIVPEIVATTPVPMVLPLIPARRQVYPPVAGWHIRVFAAAAAAAPAVIFTFVRLPEGSVNVHSKSAGSLPDGDANDRFRETGDPEAALDELSVSD